MGWGYGRSFESTQGITGRAGCKRVFTTSMCCHVWAQRKQDEGRSGKGSIFFRGDTIYSYGDHYPMGHFTDYVGKSGLPVVFINNEDYSAETRHHCSMAAGAIDATKYQIVNLHTAEMKQAMRGDITGALHQRALRMVGEMEAYRDDLLNVRKQYWIKDHSWVEVPPDERAEMLTDTELLDYCASVRIDPPPYDLAAMRSQIETMGKKWREGEPKREKDRARRAKRACIDGFMKYYEKMFKSRGYTPWSTEGKLKAHLDEICVHRPDFAPKAMQMYGERLALREIESNFRDQNPDAQNVLWERRNNRSSGISLSEWLLGVKGSIRSGHWGLGTLMRKINGRLETTMGVEVPWLAAVACFKLAQECYRANEGYVPPSTVNIGPHFTLDRIDADGTLHAGCHHLKLKDMLVLACQHVPSEVSIAPRYPLPVIVEG